MINTKENMGRHNRHKKSKLVYGVGYSGEKYPITTDGIKIKEYDAWHSILRRCYDEKYKSRFKTYNECLICDEWLLYDNFYEWLISQENYSLWKSNDYWAIDKDIIEKHNKIYCPEYCCLVPQYLNKLLLRHESQRGLTPIGVTLLKNGEIRSYCNNPFLKKQEYIGTYNNEIDAFNAYKKVKEKYIKDFAEQEYQNGIITKKCYDALKNYIVEITD